jgi:PAS domain S-box-containing protein
MATNVDGPNWKPDAQTEPLGYLRDALEALLEFTGAGAGWIGLLDSQGKLTFPVCAGTVPGAWLNLQQGQGAIWGFEVREGPTILNELPAFVALGEPALQNLMSCPLKQGEQSHGQLVLANKPQGFTSHDSTVLQTAAYFLIRHLRQHASAPAPVLPAAVLRLGLDHCQDGILMVSPEGRLLFANAAWCRWTGFSAEELIGRTAPFPFWVSHRDLASLSSSDPVLPANLTSTLTTESHPQGTPRVVYLPFRHRNHSLFWCQVEIWSDGLADQRVHVAYLRPLPAAVAVDDRASGGAVSFQTLAEKLPFAIALADGQGQVVWANHQFAHELLPVAEVIGQPIQRLFQTSSAAAVERLLRERGPGQRPERGQLVLERLDAEGNVQELVTYWHT